MVKGYFSAHLALAAFFAMAARFAFESDFARAAPPFRPPSRPRATAAGFFAGTSVAAASCVASFTIKLANAFRSDGRFLALLERSGMVPRVTARLFWRNI